MNGRLLSLGVMFGGALLFKPDMFTSPAGIGILIGGTLGILSAGAPRRRTR